MSAKNVVKIPEPIVAEIRRADRVVLLTHVHPDGDALGSAFGLAEILTGIGKEVCVFLEKPVSGLYTFLPGSDSVVTDISEAIAFADDSEGLSVTIALDTGDARRLGISSDELLCLKSLLIIDHHKSHKDFGDHRWVDPAKSSTGEMVYELAHQLDAEVSYHAAVNLYVAICTDTGSFRYESTQARTMYIAAELVERGVRPEAIARDLYDNVSLARMELLQAVLGTLNLYSGGQLAFVHVTQEMMRSTGATVDDLEGLVDYPRSLATVKVAVFIKEGTEGLVSVSLRAKGECDVAEVANKFDGGGHRNAAGIRFQDTTIEDVKSRILDELQCSIPQDREE